MTAFLASLFRKVSVRGPKLVLAKSFATWKIDESSVDELLDANKAWRERAAQEDPDFFPNLAAGQKPDFFYIGCADARVAVTSLIGIDKRQLFVHRNVANLVISTDTNVMAALTFAIEHLKIPDILVIGHYDCGGVHAAMKKQRYGPILDAWLQNIRDVYRLHRDELNSIHDTEKRHRRLVELNIVEQCLNLYKTSVVQQARLNSFHDPNEELITPQIHPLVFDPATGVVSKLPMDPRKEVSEFRDIYDLFDPTSYKMET